MEQTIQKLIKAVEAAEGSPTMSVDASVFGAAPPEDGIEKKVTVALGPKPSLPVTAYPYKKAVKEILESNGKIGIIVMDGMTTLFGTLSGQGGNAREVLHEFEANIFNRDRTRRLKPSLANAAGLMKIRKRREYIQKTSELAVQFFTDPNTKQANVEGLILGATIPYASDMCGNDMFNPSLQAKFLIVVDILCGGEEGFNKVVDEMLDFTSFPFVRCVFG